MTEPGSGAIVAVSDDLIIYAVPENWSTMSYLRRMQEELNDVVRAEGIAQRVLVVPGPARAYDFRGDEKLEALAQAVADAISAAEAPPPLENAGRT